MLIAFVYLYQQAGSFIKIYINLIYPQQNNCGYSSIFPRLRY
jgi:hypothetical protein